MALENYNKSIDNEDGLVNNLDNAIDGFKKNTNSLAKEAISALDENQLTGFIEKSFKNDNDERLTYSEMKKNSFYGFMVQSAIDMLSDKLKNNSVVNKYNENGELDENGKSLDDWIAEYNGIDNKYGSGTRKIVEMVQHILEIHEDGFAGPQFFAKICSYLKGEEYVKDFKVKGYGGNDKYIHNFDNEISEIENIKNDFINNNLTEFNDFNQYYLYGISNDTKIYKREGHEGIYYFDNNNLVFVPDTGFYVQKLSFPFNGNEKWESIYPNNCNKTRDQLLNLLNKAMEGLGLPINTYSISFSNGKYNIDSYNESIPIQLNTLINGWMYHNDLINDFKLLNLCNYLKYKKYNGKFSFSRNKTKLLLNGEELPDVFRFGSKYRKLPNPNVFLEYLNKNFS